MRLFVKISMAHFNPVITAGFLIAKHITRVQSLYYFSAEIIGALFEVFFLKFAI